MQNNCNCNCGCQQGFVPVSGNWDFNNGNCDCGCSGDYSSRNTRRRRSNGSSKQYDEYDSNYARETDYDCQCERCDDSRTVECCDQNTYVRDMDECEHSSNYNRSRSTCSCGDDCQCENCARNRSRNRSNDCNECNDSTYNRSRSNGCGCDKDDSAYNRNRSNGCGCDKEDATTYARSRKNRTVGMINVERQEIDEIFESESALRAGTLFPELHKPMNGYCPCDSNCGTCDQQSAFAAWELRLYLNTHPNDKEALALFRKLCKETGEPNYATSFLKDDQGSYGWSWVKNPWPWEYDCQCGD